MSFFDLIHQDKASHARTGVIHTDHGDVETPMFMPVGTQASVKTLDQTDLKKIDAQIILGNTYHLHLRPGEDLIAATGGLHKFMNWDRPILTDSGGFQVFSLGLQKDKKIKINNQGRLVEIDEDGVTFRSYIDGSEHRFTPEIAIEIQHKLGADIIMAFDECTPDTASEQYVREAMERTHRWAERSLAAHRNPLLTKEGRPSQAGGGLPVIATTLTDNSRLHTGRQTTPSPSLVRRGDETYQQFLFGIIQGSNYKPLREESARFISSLDFDGIAIGGESIGYNMKATAEILDWVYPIVPQDKPHYAMGIGLSPADLLIAIEHGADMFDCVGPTRLARHGVMFIGPETSSAPLLLKEGTINLPLRRGGAAGSKHRLNIKNAQYREDRAPIDATCSCSTCQNYTRSYLHHLFEAGELSGMRLATIHNIHFLLNLMREARQAILEDRFLTLRQKWIE